MGAKKLDTQVRRKQIAQAALNLVAGDGLRGLSVARVAHQVGLVPSAIYRHFKNKDEVLDAVIELIGERLLGNVEAVCAESEEPLRRLERLLMRHAGLIRESEALPHIVFSQDVYFSHSGRKARIRSVVQGYLDGVAGILRQGQQLGKIRSDIDPRTVSLMFLGLIQPAAILWHMSDGRFDLTRHAREAWKVFLEAIVQK